MPKAEGGSQFAFPIWSSRADPPLSLCDISPRKGGRGEKCIRLCGGVFPWVHRFLAEHIEISPVKPGAGSAASARMTEVESTPSPVVSLVPMLKCHSPAGRT